MLRDLLPFWQQHAVDDVFGGFTTHLRRDGSAYATSKVTAMQARIAFAFATGYRFSGDGAHLILARHAVDFMRSHLWDEEHGGWYRFGRNDGTVIDPSKHSFHQAYAVIGLAQYFQASGDAQALALASETYDLVKRFLHDDVRGGYYSGCADDWSSASTRKTGATQLDMLTAGMALFRAGAGERYLHDAIELANVMLEHMYDVRHRCFLETFNANWSYDPFETRDGVRIGHNLMAARLLLELYEITRRPDFREAARSALGFSIDFGFDRSGGFFHSAYRTGPLACVEKTWWTNAEALIALLLAMKLGHSESRYAHCFNATTQFCMEAFYDAECGEWFRSCAADGTVLDSRKGGGDKAGYHTIQACAFATDHLSQVSAGVA